MKEYNMTIYDKSSIYKYSLIDIENYFVIDKQDKAKNAVENFGEETLLEHMDLEKVEMFLRKKKLERVMSKIVS